MTRGHLEKRLNCLTLRAAVGSLVALAGSLSLTAAAQTCYTTQTLGGSSTVNLVTALETLGTSKANMNAKENDGSPASYYQISNSGGFTQSLFNTELISDAAADNDRAPYGMIFINPTNSPVTITRIDISGDRAKLGLWRQNPAPVGILPTTGWAWIDNWDVRWTGSVVVPAHSGADFIVEAKISNQAQNILNDVVTATCVTSAGTFTAVGYKTDVYVPNASVKVATAVVAFNNGAFPRGFVTGLTAGVPNTLSLQVQEYANNVGIASGLKVNIEIPEGWTNIGIVSAPAPFNGATTIVQPTQSTKGSIQVVTTGAITKGTTTAALQFRGTPPVAYANSVYSMKLALDGFDASTASHPITSVCDGVVQVLPQVAAGIQVEFLSPPLATAAVRSADFEIDYSSVNGLGNEAYQVDVFNFTTSAWENVASNVPGSGDVTVTQAYSSANIDDHLNASRQMRLRVNSPSTATSRTLRVDYLVWNALKGFTVNNATGNDTNSGSPARPLATITKAVSLLAGADPIFVTGTGAAYAGNVIVSGGGKSGTATCPTLIQGVTSGGNIPLVTPAAANDVGISVEAGANFVTVDNFKISGGLVQANVDASSNATFSNLTTEAPNGSYGILATNAPNVTVRNNAVGRKAGATYPYEGVWIWQSNGSTVDLNVIQNMSDAGIRVDYSTGANVTRNVSHHNTFGIDVVGSGGVNIYNNTFDTNALAGIHANFLTGAVTTRNNNITFNSSGFSRGDGTGPITSNYNDFFGNFQNYFYNPNTPVAAGAQDTYNNPSYVTPGSNYRLTAGSPCIDKGTNVGLPFNGSAPDQGAYEF